jgi:gas vesicle protein
MDGPVRSILKQNVNGTSARFLRKPSKKENEMDSEGLASFLLGVGVGIGVGLLFAPKTGQETRDILKGKADEGKEYLKRRGADLRDSASDIIERGKEAIGRQKDTLSEAVEAGKQAYRETVNQPMPPEGQMAR